ncbi:Acetyltransferase (GNAT) domain-containing protein [Sinomicrobium oceani]|uniref:Acetyltransferase (GNAT) domain-containing protein n=1 Tax=Sinomicrobium oceani TaxID=1150368 RepID=A0A1K1NGR8_9FLAO|nr:GNAT family N-acetyltransferase [Sinomicrobium oceani]SFW34626.1 Acetyltransferase (GNAT) domain-containing protein [Sinomicrobium oceani]
MTFVIYNPNQKLSDDQKEEVAGFLYTQLEKYGDKKVDILAAINFAMRDVIPSMGGFVLVAKENKEIVAVTVVNSTGMKGYIPENILVYIATHKDSRGKGIGKELMQKAMELADGSIALHVEPDNPAKHLYEKLGFENKYLEMRFTKK